MDRFTKDSKQPTASGKNCMESLGIRFVRLSNHEVEQHLEDALDKIGRALHPHPKSLPHQEGGTSIQHHPESQNVGETLTDSSLEIQNEVDTSFDPSSPSLLVGNIPREAGDRGGTGAGEWGVHWPAVDVIVGNPPFLGGSKMRGELGDDYYERLIDFYKGRLPGFADLVCYWFEKAREQIENGQVKRAGLLATNSIRGGRKS